MSSTAIAPAAFAQETAQVRIVAAWARLEEILAQLPPPRPLPTAQGRSHTLAPLITNPLDHPATDPDRWAQFI
ncbi:hypothetical protein IC235_11205 [Hymenobacter sp. BT664]|uniref:Uncharacterized protein n=1 Tax=Hymenobacter montanus TaxID=2771359 RepID=A0A927BCV1_9BACT|nr:hypothetical protein [Hymenobacter montanus]MBD2768457.1 hypothetical protein [Hymenobacter montanus]